MAIHATSENCAYLNHLIRCKNGLCDCFCAKIIRSNYLYSIGCWLLALLAAGIPTQQSSQIQPKKLKTPHSIETWSPMPTPPHSHHAPPFHVPFACDTARGLHLLCPQNSLLCHLGWISSSAIRIKAAAVPVLIWYFIHCTHCTLRTKKLHAEAAVTW